MTLPGGRRHGLQSAEFRRPAGLQFPITILEIRTCRSQGPLRSAFQRPRSPGSLVAAWTRSRSRFQGKSLKKSLTFSYV